MAIIRLCLGQLCTLSVPWDPAHWAWVHKHHLRQPLLQWPRARPKLDPKPGKQGPPAKSSAKASSGSSIRSFFVPKQG